MIILGTENYLLKETLYFVLSLPHVSYQPAGRVPLVELDGRLGAMRHLENNNLCYRLIRIILNRRNCKCTITGKEKLLLGWTAVFFNEMVVETQDANG
jgi:hypothetical protein